MVTDHPNSSFNPIRGILVMVLALMMWLVFGPVLAFIAMDHMEGFPESLSMYIGIHIPYIMMFLALLLGAEFILKTNLRTLLSGSGGKFRWAFAMQSGLLYTVFMVIATPAVSGGMRWNGIAFSSYLTAFIPVIILTPMQAISEELFFRAIPARIFYRDKLPTSPLASLPIVIISSAFFTFPHLWNREVTAASHMILPILCYLSWGGLAMFLSLATDGFEASTAMHVANNLFIALLVNYEGSSMPTEALFTASNAGSTATLIETFLVFLLLYLFALKNGKCLPRFRPKQQKQL